MKLVKIFAITFILIGCVSVSVFGQNNKEKLEIGSYIANTEGSATSESDGFTVTDNLRMKIRIKSVNENGAVKAEIVVNGSKKGNVSGSIDSKGNLELKGFLTSTTLTQEWEIKLAAVVDGDTLIKGKYLMTSKYVKSKGEFNIAILEE